MFALARAIVVCCRLAVKIEAYGISVTLFQIFDLYSRHVEGRRVAPANLDSKRGWKILRERCDVYSCMPWKHSKLCRSGVLLCSARSHLSIPVSNRQRKRVSVSCKGGGIAASFLAFLTPRRSRDRLSALTGNREHGEISYL